MKLDKILEFIVSVAHCQSITTVYRKVREFYFAFKTNSIE